MSRSVITSEVSFRSEGSRVSALLSRPEPPERYPVIVWSHGYGGYSGATGAAIVAQRLPEHGFTLLRIDHRGCGRSEPSAGGLCVQGRESAKTYVNAVSYLNTRTDIDPATIVLMGESHGGASALAAAALDPRVRGALATDAFSDGQSWLRDASARAGRVGRCQ